MCFNWAENQNWPVQSYWNFLQKNCWWEKWIKFQKKTQRVYHDLSLKDVYLKLVFMKKLYITHKFEVYNNAFHWPKIISSIPGIAKIYHLDYSENMTHQYKFEPQSSHFSKKQFSLHCTVLNIYHILANTFIIFQK